MAIPQLEWLSSELSDASLLKLFHDGCSYLNSPYSRKLSRLIECEPTVGLKFAPDPSVYDSAIDYFEDRQLFALVQKYQFETLTSAESRRERAVVEWKRCEALCRATNERFLRPNALGANGRQWAMIDIARRKIRNWLGRVPVSQILQASKFGPGLTLGLNNSSKVGFVDKVACDVTHTPALLPYLDVLPWEFPGWVRSHGARWCDDGFGKLIPSSSLRSTEVPGNRVTFVPKNALTDRPIAIEPLLNQFLQLGTGSVMKDRLKRAGLLLRPDANASGLDGDVSSEDYLKAQQADRHRLLVSMGSLHPWWLATIDLSSASDTVAYRLVEELLPTDWFQWLVLLRSPSGLLDGETIHYEKFSSMGNGYTFELETLVFCGLLHAAAEYEGVDLDVWGVFGDDIILPTSLVATYTSLLAFCGFNVNGDKSFFGPLPFRESCGADFFLGVNVRPLYLKDRLTNLDLLDLRSRLAELPTPSRVTGFLVRRLDGLIPEAVKHRYGVPLGRVGSYRTSSEKYWREKIQPSADLQTAVLTSKVVRVGALKRRLTGLAGILHAVESSSQGGFADLRFSPKLREDTLIDTGEHA